MEMNEKEIFYSFFEYDIGTLYLAATDKGLCFVGSLNEDIGELELGVANLFSKKILIEDKARLKLYHQQLAEYFNDSRTAFTFPIDVNGTPFQQKVWRALKDIPFGETKSYGEIAAEIEQPYSYRAVGTAIGKNPLLIVVPCHRVIHKNGKLDGYRGKLDMKEKLLKLEKKISMGGPND